MNRRRFVRAMAVAPLLASSAGIAAGAVSHRISPPSSEFMTTTLPRLLEIAAVPGICIGVLCKGQPAWEAHAGILNLETKTAATAATLWKAASLSEQATAYAALRMVDARMLDLDRPLAYYLGVPGEL